MWYYEGRIRIEPDWNVKLFQKRLEPKKKFIRIKPNWNSKNQYAMNCIWLI